MTTGDDTVTPSAHIGSPAAEYSLLRDGGQALIRRMVPGDRAAVQRFYTEVTVQI